MANFTIGPVEFKGPIPPYESPPFPAPPPDASVLHVLDTEEKVTWTFPPSPDPSEWDRTLGALETLYAALPSLQARRSACTAVQLATRWLGWLWGVE